MMVLNVLCNEMFLVLLLPLDIYILFIFKIYYILLYLPLHIHCLKKNFVANYTLYIYTFGLFIFIYITLYIYFT